MKPVSSRHRTLYGCFGTDSYETQAQGVDIKLTFDPDPALDAKKIGLVQTVRSAVGGEAVPLHPSERGLIFSYATEQARAAYRIGPATPAGAPAGSRQLAANGSWIASARC